MKFFLSATQARKQEMRNCRAQLQAMGHKVVSTWLDVDVTPETIAEIARREADEIRSCDVFVAFTGYASPDSRVEFGLALGFAKPIIVVGPLETIFHHLPHVCGYDNWRLARQFIETAYGSNQ